MLRKTIGLFFLLFLTVPVFSQNTKAEKALLKELNNILSQTPTIHFAYTDPMKIDSAFAIDTSKTLSVTVRYTSVDSGYYRIRMAVKLADVETAFQDMYLLLECKPAAVHLYESKFNSEQLVFIENRDLFHVGLKEDDGKTLERLQKKLEVLKGLGIIK